MASRRQPPISDLAKKKVAGFILRKNVKGQSELLVHEFGEDPSLPWRVPGGNVDEQELPEGALFREILEETGLEDLNIVRKLGIREYFKPYIQSNVERHDFLLAVPQNVPDSWEHEVTGGGGDTGAVFRFHWMGPEALERVDEEHRSYITPESIPELFEETKVLGE